MFIIQIFFQISNYSDNLNARERSIERLASIWRLVHSEAWLNKDEAWFGLKIKKEI